MLSESYSLLIEKICLHNVLKFMILLESYPAFSYFFDEISQTQGIFKEGLPKIDCFLESVGLKNLWAVRAHTMNML